MTEPESTLGSKPRQRFTVAQVGGGLSAAFLVLGIGIGLGARSFCSCVSPAVNLLTIVLLVVGFAGVVMRRVIEVRGQRRHVLQVLMASSSLGLGFSALFVGDELFGPLILGAVISGTVGWLAQRGGGGGGSAFGGDFGGGGGGDGGGAC